MASSSSFSRLPLLLLLVGSVFLALVSDSVGHNAFWENYVNSRQQSQNPYHFRSHNFQTQFQNEHGRIRILPRFDQKHNHLRRLQNYRLEEFELQPHSLFIPHHRDAEALILAHEGRAIVGMMNGSYSETFHLEQGEVLRVPAGCLVFTANVEQNQRFRATNLLIPINIPARYENFYPSGNQNPRSFYHAFSQETLEATFNTNFNEIRRVLFGMGRQQQGGQGQEESSNEGVMVRISREHARELRRHAESSSPRKRSRSSSSSSWPKLNLRNLEPLYSNENGRLWEACPDKFELILRDLDVSVSILELKKGSLFLPHYNSKAIAVAQIIEGEAELEVASPHLANEQESEEEEEQGGENRGEEQQQQRREEEEQSEGQIQRLSSTLKERDAFVVLAGHPIALRASNQNDVRMVAFLLNAENNQRNFLGGERDNVINQLQRAMKGQTFAGSGEEVDKLMRKQKESYFVNAQRRRHQQQRGEEEEEGERRTPLSSILEQDF